MFMHLLGVHLSGYGVTFSRFFSDEFYRCRLGTVQIGNVMMKPYQMKQGTPLKFNIAPEKWWLEDYFPFGKVTFQGLC